MLKGGLFKFWDTEFPDPGGTDFAVEVYDASGEKGSPGKNSPARSKLKRSAQVNGRP